MPRAYRLADKRRVLRQDKPRTCFVLIVCGTESMWGASKIRYALVTVDEPTSMRNIVTLIFNVMPNSKVDSLMYIEHLVSFLIDLRKHILIRLIGIEFKLIAKVGMY